MWRIRYERKIDVIWFIVLFVDVLSGGFHAGFGGIIITDGM
jgi:hypothetical protein